VLLLVVAALSSAALREFSVEAAHSHVGFSIDFFGHPVRGQFDDIRGSVTLVAAHPESSSVTIAVASSSINTGSRSRDDHLRSSDFFDAQRFPTLFFTSRIVRRTRAGLLVTGPLTMHGVTHEVTAVARQTSAPVIEPHGSVLVYFSATMRLSRQAFGIHGGDRFNTWFDDLRQRALADSVDVTIELQSVDLDYDRSPRWSKALDELLRDGAAKRVAAWRNLALQHPDSLRDDQWELEQLGRGLVQRARPSDAVLLAEFETEMFPRSAAAFSALARALEANDDAPRAATVAEHAIALDPFEPRAVEIRKRVRPAQGR